MKKWNMRLEACIYILLLVTEIVLLIEGIKRGEIILFVCSVGIGICGLLLSAIWSKKN